MCVRYRAWPTALTNNTVVMPLIAPAATMYLAQLHPTASNATEKGASSSICWYDCMRQSVTARMQYAEVVITMDPTRPMGISFPGFLVSSANVETASNPTYAKNKTAEATKMPRGPNGAKGVKFLGLALVSPAMTMKRMTITCKMDAM